MGLLITFALSLTVAAPAAIDFDAAHMRFTLHGPDMAYVLRVADGDLVHEHWGAPADAMLPTVVPSKPHGWRPTMSATPREYPDLGRGDLRGPAVRIVNGDGQPVSDLRYLRHEIARGKPPLDGLPATFAGTEAVETLRITLLDSVSKIEAVLSYSIFPNHNSIARHVAFTNRGKRPVTLQNTASFSVDLPPRRYTMMQLSGDWARERQEVTRPVVPGIQAVQSQMGFSGHEHNPFVALLADDAEEDAGEVFALNLVYSGSFSAQVEQNPQGLVRMMMGLNPAHTAWTLQPNETFVTPECIGVYAADGLGGMSRHLHDLYRNNLSRSSWQQRARPVLLNNWEATHFDFAADEIVRFAQDANQIGIQLMVLDDGWFGHKHPRNDEQHGLGDWVANPNKLPEGVAGLGRRINAAGPRFGLWVEPEMVNANSELFEAHPDWVLQARGFAQTEQRHQRVLDLSQRAVQDHLIATLRSLLRNAPIAYVKWDLNRAIYEVPSLAAPHAYILGLYRVVDVITHEFDGVLFESCASGGGRFDPGMLHYMPQSWTSDNTDGVDRLQIQFGTSIAYPASSMGGHVSAVPNHQSGRITPMQFRAHVAMMCGSFGFELDLGKLTALERAQLPGIMRLYEQVQPLVQNGDMYRLRRPARSNWPALAFVSKDRNRAVAMAYQVRNEVNVEPQGLRFVGLDPAGNYRVTSVGAKDNASLAAHAAQASAAVLGTNGQPETEPPFTQPGATRTFSAQPDAALPPTADVDRRPTPAAQKGTPTSDVVLSGRTLMSAGVDLQFYGDFDSRVVLLERVP